MKQQETKPTTTENTIGDDSQLEIAGYICMSRPKHLDPLGWMMQPMAYGNNGDPWPDELLHSRGATLFKTKKEAEDALMRTLRVSEERGDEWTSKYNYLILSVRYA